MATINYRFYDGHYEEVEVTEETAEVFKQSNREEWRIRKSCERHETKVSLTQMQHDIGYDHLTTVQHPKNS